MTNLCLIQAWLYRTAYCMFVDHWRYGKRKSIVTFDIREETLLTETFSPEVLCLEFCNLSGPAENEEITRKWSNVAYFGIMVDFISS